ncbi:hypothetical protein H1235_01550 [Pseudoxanthomonas sp. NC8]|nr:hypothetical protein H1235_01550 [Pseudoxanthomonas sp. NC8]
MPYESIAEQQTMTGGYGAEFGRSLGGVVNMVSKRGTNEFQLAPTCSGRRIRCARSRRAPTTPTRWSRATWASCAGQLRGHAGQHGRLGLGRRRHRQGQAVRLRRVDLQQDRPGLLGHGAFPDQQQRVGEGRPDLAGEAGLGDQRRPPPRIHRDVGQAHHHDQDLYQHDW